MEAPWCMNFPVAWTLRRHSPDGIIGLQLLQSLECSFPRIGTGAAQARSRCKVHWCFKRARRRESGRRHASMIRPWPAAAPGRAAAAAHRTPPAGCAAAPASPPGPRSAPPRRLQMHRVTVGKATTQCRTAHAAKFVFVCISAAENTCKERIKALAVTALWESQLCICGLTRHGVLLWQTHR